MQIPACGEMKTLPASLKSTESADETVTRKTTCEPQTKIKQKLRETRGKDCHEKQYSESNRYKTRIQLFTQSFLFTYEVSTRAEKSLRRSESPSLTSIA